MEPHNRLPHNDDVLRVHPLHLAELRHDLLVVVDALVAESGQDIFREEARQHLIDAHKLNHVLLHFVVCSCVALASIIVLVIFEHVFDIAGAGRSH